MVEDRLSKMKELAAKAQKENEGKTRLEAERVAEKAKMEKESKHTERSQVEAELGTATEELGQLEKQLSEAETMPEQMGDVSEEIRAEFDNELKALRADAESARTKVAELSTRKAQLDSELGSATTGETAIEAGESQTPPAETGNADVGSETPAVVKEEAKAEETKKGMTEEEIKKGDDMVVELLKDLPVDAGNKRMFEILDGIKPTLGDKKGREQLLATINKQLENIDKIDPELVKKFYGSEAAIHKFLSLYIENLGDSVNTTAEDRKGEKYEYVSPEAKPLYEAAGNQLLQQLKGSKDYAPFQNDLTYFIQHEVTRVLTNHKNAGGEPSVRQDVLRELERVIGGNVEAQNKSGLMKEPLKKENMSTWKQVQELKKQFPA